MAYSNFGALYITGDFTSTRNFGATTTKTAVGYNDVYITVLDTGGNQLWTATGGDLFSYGYASAIALDFSGNVYAAGYFTGAIKFGSFTVNSVGQSDIFIVKLDFAGNPVWLKRAGGSLFDEVNGMMCDGTHLYMTGFYTGNASFETTTLNSSGTNDTEIFLAKYDLKGDLVWVTDAGGPGEDAGADVVKDGAGDLVVTGEFGNTASFGSSVVSSVAFSDVFIAKYDDSGSNIWATSGGGKSNDVAAAIGYDNSGNVYICGSIGDTATFGSYTVLDNGFGNVFVAKLNASGAWQWAKGGGSNSGDWIYDMSVRKNDGNTYVTGYLNGPGSFGTKFIPSNGVNDAFVMRYNNAGTEMFGINIGGNNYDQGKSISADEGGGVIYLTGEYTGNVTIGNNNLPVPAPSTWFQFVTRISTGTVGLPEVSAVDFNLFPNPSSDVVYLSPGEWLRGPAEITVTDVTGRLVKRQQADLSGHAVAIPLSGLPAGRYTLSLIGNAATLHKGFIVTH